MGKKGLENVVAGESSITSLDGQKALMKYRGYDIIGVSKEATFEEICYLLWYGELPKKDELEDIGKRLASQRDLPDQVIDYMKNAPKKSPMAILRTCVSMLSDSDDNPDDMEPAAEIEKTISLTSKIATITANLQRFWEGKDYIKPDSTLTHAANFLYMVNGEKPTDEQAKMFDTCLILHADHEFNASTFASRVCAATLSDMYSAIVAGICTLKGKLHGGANEKVMMMLQDIGSPDNAESYIRKKLDNKEKIMGFGHRVYKTGDPRAPILKDFVKKLCDDTGKPEWFQMCLKIEQIIMEEKKLYPNVDFYSGSVFSSLGIDPKFFTLIFASGRVSGWSAHVMEQHQNNRLIRPASNYTGHGERPYVALDKR